MHWPSTIKPKFWHALLAILCAAVILQPNAVAEPTEGGFSAAKIDKMTEQLKQMGEVFKQASDAASTAIQALTQSMQHTTESMDPLIAAADRMVAIQHGQQPPDCPCKAGWYLSDSLKMCFECPKNFFSLEGATECTPCPFGQKTDKSGSSACKDVNECADASLNNCHTNATCSNSMGSFVCACSFGFKGNGTFCGRECAPQMHLTASDGAANDQFGYSVSVSSFGGDSVVAVVGAHYDDDRGANSGSAYVFRVTANGTATQTAKLTPSDGAAWDHFGWSVSVSSFGSNGDSVVVVGSPWDDDRGKDSGSAYVFSLAFDGTATQTAKLTSSDGAAWDYFGESISVSSFGSSGDAVAIVGAKNDDDRGDNSGSAYVFRLAADGTATQTAKLTASDGADSDRFGVSVGLSSFGNSGNAVAVVGANWDDDRGSSSGSAFVFSVASDGTTTQIAKLTASDGAGTDRFGWSVSVSSFGGIGDAIVVVGAHHNDDSGSDSGSAYVFRLAADGAASQTAKLTASDGAESDYFGVSVSVSSLDSNGNAVAVVGAFYDDDRGSKSGGAYVFRVAADGTATQTVKLTAIDGASNDEFGRSVSVAMTDRQGSAVALAGAPQANPGEKSDAGSAYAFALPVDQQCSHGSLQQRNYLKSTCGPKYLEKDSNNNPRVGTGDQLNIIPRSGPYFSVDIGGTCLQDRGQCTGGQGPIFTTCSASADDQQFELTANRELKSKDTSCCLDISGYCSGSSLLFYSCDGANKQNQQFEFVSSKN